MITFEISETPVGVTVTVQGDLDGLSDAAFAARGMVVYAGALFVGGKPVLLSGDADPVQLPKPVATPHDIHPGQPASGNYASLERGQWGGP